MGSRFWVQGFKVDGSGFSIQARSESRLHAGCIQSASEDSTFKLLQAGINPISAQIRIMI